MHSYVQMSQGVHVCERWQKAALAWTELWAISADHSCLHGNHSGQEKGGSVREYVRKERKKERGSNEGERHRTHVKTQMSMR